MVKEHDRVVLTKNLPEEKLKAGDIGMVVHIHNRGAAYEVEFATRTGETVAVVTVEASHVRPLNLWSRIIRMLKPQSASAPDFQSLP